MLVRDLEARDLDALMMLFSANEQLHRQNVPGRFREPEKEYPATLTKQCLNDPLQKFVAEQGKQPLGYVAEEFARARGFKEIELNVWAFNKSAQEFYSEIGHRPARTYYSKEL